MTSEQTDGLREQAAALLRERFSQGAETCSVFVPGRVNLIGEHIDYHSLPVLPAAIQRGITLVFRARPDLRVRMVSGQAAGICEFDASGTLVCGASGDWGNYVKAGAAAAMTKWKLTRGIDAAAVSTLPSAAGLSSSSALLTAAALALLSANGIRPSFDELMDVLPEGEYFVGTRGGGMDHAAVLGGRAGSAVLVEFSPARAIPIQVPEDWAFIIAHSLTTAEKSSHAKLEYNSRRVAGTAALEKLGYLSYREAWEDERVRDLPEAERCAFLHVVREGARVRQAVAAMQAGDAAQFGKLLFASHVSLRDKLRVSTPALDALVEAAASSGALGARLTGAGFGGCVIVFCKRKERRQVRQGLIRRFYRDRSRFQEDQHLINVIPSAGALYV